MAHKLQQLLVDTIAAGLSRRSVTKCSTWSEKYRVMGKPFPGLWTFKYHPWAREMHDCTAELMVGQKGAQLAFTETALNKTFFAIDILRESVLYILPASNPDASDFSTSRFDPALELSPHLSSMFSDVKNIGHKRAGSANLFIRGSRSRSQLKSLPVARLIADEVDEMNQDNLNLAFERMSGQVQKQAFLLSTPTVTDVGINAYYKMSTQEHFFFRCPHCNKLTELVFPDCIVITADHINDPRIMDTHIICKECKQRLEQSDKPSFLASGIWVPQNPGAISRGFHVNQLYSYTVRPYELATNYLKSQADPTSEQEFYNSKLGEPHEVAGARITDDNLDKCRAGYRSAEAAPKQAFLTMGIDVGKFLHYEIVQWFFDQNVRTQDINLMATAKVIKADKCKDFSELDKLMAAYNIYFAVIDNQPETRLAKEFCQRWYGRALTCHYSSSQAAHQLSRNDKELQLNANRTSWLDLSLGRFKIEKIKLPFDISQEYRDHMKCLVRVYEKDRDGNPVGRYVKPEHAADHFAHARNYAEIALPMAASLMRSENINDLW